MRRLMAVLMIASLAGVIPAAPPARGAESKSILRPFKNSSSSSSHRKKLRRKMTAGKTRTRMSDRNRIQNGKDFFAAAKERMKNMTAGDRGEADKYADNRSAIGQKKEGALGQFFANLFKGKFTKKKLPPLSADSAPPKKQQSGLDIIAAWWQAMNKKTSGKNKRVVKPGGVTPEARARL